MHTVAQGETLSGISRRYYGTPNRWTEIFAANRDTLRDERSLVAGRTLRIP
jgi:nucleoid-associated protein YgaU